MIKKKIVNTRLFLPWRRLKKAVGMACMFCCSGQWGLDSEDKDNFKHSLGGKLLNVTLALCCH